MKLKKSLFVVMLAGMTVSAMVGCGKAEEPAPATEQPAPTIEQPAPTSGQPALNLEGIRPAPPQGGPSDNISGNRPPPPAMDLAAAAKLLGVSEESLQAALELPAGGPPPGGPPPGGPGPTGQGQ